MDVLLIGLAVAWAVPLVAVVVLIVLHIRDGGAPPEREPIPVIALPVKGSAGNVPSPHAELEWLPGMLVQQSNPRRTGR